MIEKNKIYNMDCIEGLKQIDKESIDAVITDPPYNISRETNFSTMKGHRGTSMDYGEWDKDADITSFIKELPRILKVGANVVIFNCWENLGDIAKVMRENSIEPKRCLVLSKSNPAPFNRERLFVNDVEFAVWGVYKNKDWIFNREERLEKCVINTTVQGKKLHPTMKDIKVIEKLVRVLSKSGGVILDCFMGSGTLALACKNTNRDFIGFEIDKKYCDIANDRITKFNGIPPSPKGKGILPTII
jgi:site-specific DNA-methyltransferase (adenine-specific)